MVVENLVNLQQLYNNTIFKVPDYQRGYSWEKSNVIDILEDLDRLRVEKEKKHYGGTFIFIKPKNSTIEGLGNEYTIYQIVDGQQRMTTITILIHEIVEALEKGMGEYSEEDRNTTIERLTRQYLKEKATRGEVYKLILDEHNDHFFKERILGCNNNAPIINSHKNLIEAKNVISEHLKKKIDSDSHYLNNLIKKVTVQLVFTVYQVTDESEGGVIFETMNDRGLTLTDLEKFKNFLLYLSTLITDGDVAREEIARHINSAWGKILQNLYNYEISDNAMSEDQFLRFSIILKFYGELPQFKQGRISNNQLLAEKYRLLKKYFLELYENKNQSIYEEIKDFVSYLENLSNHYRDISMPKDSKAFAYISDTNLREKIRTAIIRFNRMDSRASFQPLILSIFFKNSNAPEILADLLEFLEKVSFRVYGIKMLRSHAGQSTLYDLAYKMYRQNITNEELRSGIREFDELYFNTTIRRRMELDREQGINYYRWSYLRYFLYEYEIWKCQTNSKGMPQYSWEDGIEKRDLNTSVEHILPQTYPSGTKYWTDKFDKENHAINSVRLGNLCLTDQNQNLSNRRFDEKKEFYKKSNWQIERDLSNYEEWTVKEINRREEEMIKFAEERWKI